MNRRETGGHVLAWGLGGGWIGLDPRSLLIKKKNNDNAGLWVSVFESP